MRTGRILAVAVACALGLAGAASAAVVAQYHLDGDATDSVGTFDGTINGGAGFVPSPYGGGQAIDLAGGGKYVDTVATSGTASNLGLGGANAKTISAWARPESFNNGGIWDLGPNSGGNMFCLRTNTGTNSWRAQFWAGDFDIMTPNAANNWGHYALTYDGTTARAYYNGAFVGSLTRALNTLDTRPFEIGRYAGGTTFDGQIDEVRVDNAALTGAQIKAEYQAMGGYAEDFEGYGSQIDTGQWYTSGGMNSTRLRTNRGGQGGTLLSTFDNDANNPTPGVRNVSGPHQDHVTSLTWGHPMLVKDASSELSFALAGGSFAAVDGSQTGGGVGVALWDLSANDFVRDAGAIRLVTRSGNGGLQSQSISLAGLAGRVVIPVLYDRQAGGWGWTELDTLTALPGAVQVVDPHHKVTLDYGFDNAGDLMGWTGDTGMFSVGFTGGGTPSQFIDLNGIHVGTEGYLSSGIVGMHENATGDLRSPTFTVEGDIIEFYISGGSNADLLSFELRLAGDDSLLETSTSDTNRNQFAYDFWNVAQYQGQEVYLQLHDAHTGAGGWGHIEVDAIRMVDFAVPEPATMALLGLAACGLGGYLRRRRKA